MKILSALKSGLTRAARAWKAILIYWIISFLLVSMVVVPLKASLRGALGKSMITDKLMEGLNIDVLGDMGPAFHTIISSIMGSIMILALVSMLVNVFITGGIFDAVKNGSGRLTYEDFFKASARNFKSFLIILVLLYMIILVLALVIILLPFSIASNSVSSPEGTGFRLLRISLLFFGVLLAVLLLAADYARAWQVVKPRSAGFRAFGFGFGQTFRTLLFSFPLMVLMLFVQGLVAYVVFRIISGFTPSGGGGVVLLFIISQLVMLVNIFMRVVRYAAVTTLMELKPVKEKIKIPAYTDAPQAPEPIAEAI
jgi:hypothetical protein